MNPISIYPTVCSLAHPGSGAPSCCAGTAVGVVTPLVVIMIVPFKGTHGNGIRESSEETILTKIEKITLFYKCFTYPIGFLWGCPGMLTHYPSHPCRRLLTKSFARFLPRCLRSSMIMLRLNMPEILL